MSSQLTLSPPTFEIVRDMRTNEFVTLNYNPEDS